MELIQDRNRVRLLAEERAAENADFRDYLKTGLGWSNRRLNALVYQIGREVQAAVDCRGCGDCCRGLDISVTAPDIRRLSRGIGIAPEEFAGRYTRLDEDGDPEIPSAPCCPFLSGNLCSVYRHRPKTCRSYPHLHRDFRARSHQLLRNVGKCPIVFNVLEELKARLAWRWSQSG
jgi:uncharacterized protein